MSVNEETAMEARLHEVGERIDALWVAVREAGEDVEGRFEEIIRNLRAGLDRTLSELRRLRHDDREAWQTYQAEVDRAATTMNHDVDVARAQLEERLASSHEAFADAVEREVNGWRGRVDDLRVQASLARMDATDEFAELLEPVERQLARATHRLEDLRAASTESWSALRLGIEESLGTLKDSVNEAVKAFD